MDFKFVSDDMLQKTTSFNGGVMQKGREILFQLAFNWESHKYGWWKNLEKKVAYLAKCGFTSAIHSFSPEALLQKKNQNKVRAMADMVINHRVGTTRGGAYNRYDRIPLSWNEHAVTSCSGGLAWFLQQLQNSKLEEEHQDTF